MESAGYTSITVETANINFIKALAKMSKFFLGTENLSPDIAKYISGPSMMGDYLTDWCDTLDKPLVLLLDKVDALYDDVLISTLRQLRDGFQTRPKYFPQSIALVGLRDIRDLRTPSPADIPSIGSGSLFNIIAESFFLPVFSKEEVRGLLDQHTYDTDQVFSVEVFEKLYSYSGGLPWLTNALANEVVSEMLKNDYSLEITLDLIELAKERLIEQRQTHMDSLAEKIDDSQI
jgi:hypothetical protein